MSTRVTKGKALVGSLSIDSSGGVSYAAGRATTKIYVQSVTQTSTCETDSGWDLPASAVVENVWAEVTTVGATGTMDVGLLSSESGGDLDGLLKSVSILTTGIRVGKPVVSSTAGSFYQATTRGAFLADFSAGTTGSADAGLYNPKDHPSDSVTAKSLSYRFSTGSSGAVALIYVEYVEI